MNLMKFLPGTMSNHKSDLSELFDSQFVSKILYLYPTFKKEINTCPGASAACRAACLVNCGHAARFKSINEARKRRTERFFSNPTGSTLEIEHDIKVLRLSAEFEKRQLCMRLNGTSDIDFSYIWESRELSSVIFNEYTKRFDLMDRFLSGHYGDNVHFTFSWNGANKKNCLDILKRGGSVAIPYAGEFQGSLWGYPCVSGDKHDFRFMDRKLNAIPKGKGFIVLLKAKGTKESIQKGVKSKFFMDFN